MAAIRQMAIAKYENHVFVFEDLSAFSHRAGADGLEPLRSQDRCKCTTVFEVG
jgi:hypothetical protein